MKTRTHLRVIAQHLSIYLSIYLSIICLVLPQSAWGATSREKSVNIYASLLSSSLSGKTATLKLAVNAEYNKKGVWVYIDKDGDGVCEESEVILKANDYLPSNVNVLNLPQIQNLPGGKYKWAVKVWGDNTNKHYNTSGSYFVSKNNTDHIVESTRTRPARANIFDIDSRYEFQYPKGLAVNTYHDSRYLGFSYVGEAANAKLATDNSASRRTPVQGIYMYRPNVGYLWSGHTSHGFTGGITWRAPDISRNKYFGPNRVSTDKDGFVYVAENRPATDANSENRIWRVLLDYSTASGTNPNFTCILTQTQLINAGFAGRVFSISIGYEGDDKLLYVISGSTSSAVVSSATLSVWKITENPFKIEYTGRSLSLTNIKQGNTTHILKSPQCSVVPGRENGDLWIFQRTDAYEDSNGNKIAASGQFSALHLSKSGNNWVADYHIPSKAKDADDEYHQNSSGTGAISTHHVIGNTNEYYLAMPCRAGENSSNPTGYVVKVFRMYKNNTGLHRARWWNLYRTYKSDGSGDAGWGHPTKDGKNPAPGEGIDGIAFDAANNMYFTTTGRHLYVFALPKENWHMTYGPTMLHVPYGTTTWVPNQVTYDLVSGAMKELILDTDPMPVLSKEGWIFEGWYNNLDEPVPSVYADDLTLHAKWTEIKINEGTEADNEPIIDLVKGQKVGMKVNRKMPGGSFSTLCLPFAINATVLNSVTWDEGSDLTGNPLEGATLWTFSGVETDAKANTKTLVFTQTNEEVPANTPFLILPQNDVAEDIFFHNVTIDKATDLTNAGEVSYGGITFHGFINPVLLKASPNNFFLVANNRLATSYYDSMLPALRGYFTNNTGSQLLIRTQQGTPSLLDDVNSNIKNTYKIQKDGKIYIVRDHIVYDLQGNRVAKF